MFHSLYRVCCKTEIVVFGFCFTESTEHFGAIDYKQNLQAFQRGIPARWRLKPGCYEWDADTCLIQFVGKDLYTLMERGTLRVKRLAKNHRTLTAAGTQSQCIRSGV